MRESHHSNKNEHTAQLHRMIGVLQALGQSRWPQALPVLERYISKGTPLPVSLASFKAMSLIALLAPLQASLRVRSEQCWTFN